MKKCASTLVVLFRSGMYFETALPVACPEVIWFVGMSGLRADELSSSWMETCANPAHQITLDHA